MHCTSELMRSFASIFIVIMFFFLHFIACHGHGHDRDRDHPWRRFCASLYMNSFAFPHFDLFARLAARSSLEPLALLGWQGCHSAPWRALPFCACTRAKNCFSRSALSDDIGSVGGGRGELSGGGGGGDAGGGGGGDAPVAEVAVKMPVVEVAAMTPVAGVALHPEQVAVVLVPRAVVARHLEQVAVVPVPRAVATSALRVAVSELQAAVSVPRRRCRRRGQVSAPRGRWRRRR